MDSVLEFLFHLYEFSELIELIMKNSSLICYYINNALLSLLD